ncbi:MAG: hypothetical protein WBB45_04020 [Cyclobacteriaceae bacterium]
MDMSHEKQADNAIEGPNDLHKELDLIQAVISRMAHNSFLIKGWAMTLISALIAFGKDLILGKDSGITYMVMMIGIIFPFWWLDAYYLKQERAFRKLYDNAITYPNAISRTRFALNPKVYLKEVGNTWKNMGRDAIIWFYIPIIIIVLVGIVARLTGVM